MADRPSGVLTLLFTDIEGSTGLIQQLGDGYGELLQHHHRILRDAFANHRGYEVDAAGDGFFVVFPTPEDALAAALYGQRALISYAWPDGVGVRVRMGLHTGDPIWTSVGYVGLHVHRAARVCSAAHGNQIVVSKACADLVREPFRSTLTFSDLGEHHLEGLLDPEHILQVVVDDLPANFPPLRSRSKRAKEQRAQLTPIVGRTTEIEELSRMLLEPDTRLVTLLGTGGTGKTRLAMELVAHLEPEFANGVHFVDLAPVDDVGHVASTFAASIGLRGDLHRDPLKSLIEYLAKRRSLIVLDNFEQVIGAAELLLEVLTHCPSVVFLITSRTALRLSIEQSYPLPPLALPRPKADDKDIAASPAVALFVERAKATDPWFDKGPAALKAVAAICRTLDGLPLAIELAAARTALMSAEELLPMLERRLDILTDGARDLPARQRRLRDCIAWSYDALSARDQALLRALSVFRGGFTLAAVEAVCASEPETILSSVTSLMNQSLLRRESMENGKPRLMVLGTIGEFGREQLAGAAEESTYRLRHVDYYRRMARMAQPMLFGESQFRELARLETELDNIRAALDWGLQDPEASDAALDLAASLLTFWWHRYIGEGSRRLQQLLDVPANRTSRHRARALAHASFLYFYQGDITTCERLANESVELCRGQPKLMGTLITGLGLIARVASSRNQHSAALASAAEGVALSRALGGGWTLAVALGPLGDVAFATDDRTLAEQSWNESVEVFRSLGETWLIAAPIARLGDLAVRQGDAGRARRLFEESLGLWRAAGNGAGTPQAIAGVARLAMLEADWVHAAASSRESLLLAQQLGSTGEYSWGLAGVAASCVAIGNYEVACRLFAAADALGRAAGHSMHSFTHNEFAPSLAQLRLAIAGPRYEVLTREGAALSPENAIAIALASESEC